VPKQEITDYAKDVKKKINKPRKCDGGAKEEEEEDGTESRKATN